MSNADWANGEKGLDWTCSTTWERRGTSLFLPFPLSLFDQFIYQSSQEIRKRISFIDSLIFLFVLEKKSFSLLPLHLRRVESIPRRSTCTRREIQLNDHLFSSPLSIDVFIFPVIQLDRLVFFAWCSIESTRLDVIRCSTERRRRRRRKETSR